MKCETCTTEITSQMRHSIASNTCPYCGLDIMSPEKAEQYLNLVELLDHTSFTNKPDFDSQLREKFASLMITNFAFMRISPQEEDSDLIVLGATSPKKEQSFIQRPTPPKISKPIEVPDTPEIVEKVQQVDSHGRPMNAYMSLDPEELENEVKSIPSSPRKPTKSVPGAPSLPNYAAMQEEMYEGNAPKEELDIEQQAQQILSQFPELQEQAAAAGLGAGGDPAKQKDLQKLQSYQSRSKGLSGSGIRRKER